MKVPFCNMELLRPKNTGAVMVLNHANEIDGCNEIITFVTK